MSFTVQIKTPVTAVEYAPMGQAGDTLQLGIDYAEVTISLIITSVRMAFEENTWLWIVDARAEEVTT